MEIEDGKASVFIHARQFGDDRGQTNLSPHRIETRTPRSHDQILNNLGGAVHANGRVVTCEWIAARLRNTHYKPCYVSLKVTQHSGKVKLDNP